MVGTTSSVLLGTWSIVSIETLVTSTLSSGGGCGVWMSRGMDGDALVVFTATGYWIILSLHVYAIMHAVHVYATHYMLYEHRLDIGTSNTRRLRSPLC